MVETLHYQSYLRSVLRLYAFMAAGLFESNEADALREQMVEPWYALSNEERQRLDGLVLAWWQLVQQRERLAFELGAGD
jgi:uncharacterized NAD(P)/FAD-binding protein YdhS